MIGLPRSCRRTGGPRTAIVALVVLLCAVCEPAAATEARSARAAPTAARVPRLEAFVTEAAARFNLPVRWIRLVLQAESAGDPHAVSRAGAMGLMQIMPATWAELRARHDLGTDPYDPRDNILAGAAYLRAMLDRFGTPGFLAAYNAGPERYAAHLATGRPLPRETRAYLAALAPRLGEPAAPVPLAGPPTLIADWRDASIFVVRGKHGPDTGLTPDPAAAFDFRAEGPLAPTGVGASPAGRPVLWSAPMGPQMGRRSGPR